MYVQTASDAIGWSLCKNCTLKRAVVVVCEGEDFPKPP